MASQQGVARLSSTDNLRAKSARFPKKKKRQLPVVTEKMMARKYS